MRRLRSFLIRAIASATLAFTASMPAQAQLPDTDIFFGCENIELATIDTVAGNETDRGAAPAPVTEVQTAQKTRMLQGQPSTQVIGTTEANESCWARLDGVWQDDTDIRWDSSVRVDGWAASSSALRSLTHGTFTDASFMVVMPGTDMEKVINIVDPFDPNRRATFVSSDGVPLKDVLQIRGPRKVYTSRRDTGFGTELLLDVDGAGFLRIKVGGSDFRRPSPGLVGQMATNDLEMSHVFLFQSNLDNFIASRTGYDITTADPFSLVRTGKKPVFAEVYGTQYRILEKRAVPLGFTLKPETDQGMLFTRRFMSTETELQTAVSAAFGGKARVGLAPGGVKLGPSGSAGIDVTVNAAAEMRNSRSSSKAVGNSMTKKYSIIVDHPFVELSDEFLAAIEDARRYGDENPEYYNVIVDKFGTHYPYAVTYGANAQLSVMLSEKATYERSSIGGSVRVEGEIEAVTGAVSGYAQVAGERGTGLNETSGEETVTFRAIGGNGSWDASGYAAGDRAAPIQLDLRSLDELLNPVNFPGQPEVYEKVRTKLHARIRDYLDLRAAGLSDWPIYDTRLNGRYYSEAFPEFIFNFEAKDYVNSELSITTVDGRSWHRYMNERINERDFAPNAEILDLANKIGVEHKGLYTNKLESGFSRALAFERSAAGPYISKASRDLWKDRYAALESGVVDADFYDHMTLNGEISANATWFAQPDGTIILSNPRPDGEDEVITLHQWGPDEQETLTRARLAGAWRSDAWPGVVLLNELTDRSFYDLVITNEDGGLPALDCAEGLEDIGSPRDRRNIADVAKMRLIQPRRMEAAFRLPFDIFERVGMMKDMMKLGVTDDMRPQDRAQFQLLNCLMESDTPYGSLPAMTNNMIGYPGPEAPPAFPVLVMDESGQSAEVLFMQPLLQDDPTDEARRDSVMDLIRLNVDFLEPVGEPIRLERLTAAEERTVRGKYSRFMDQLRQDIEDAEKAQEDEPS